MAASTCLIAILVLSVGIAAEKITRAPSFSECARDPDCADASETTLDLCLAGACVHIETGDELLLLRRQHSDRGIADDPDLLSPPPPGQCNGEFFAPRGMPCGTNKLCGFGACDGRGRCADGPVCIRRKSDVRILANVLVGAVIALVAVAFVVSFAVSEMFGGEDTRRDRHHHFRPD